MNQNIQHIVILLLLFNLHVFFILHEAILKYGSTDRVEIQLHTIVRYTVLQLSCL